MKAGDILYILTGDKLITCVCDDMHDDAIYYTQLDNNAISGIVDKNDIKHVQINLFDKGER